MELGNSGVKYIYLKNQNRKAINLALFLLC
jgi:hypothetical protein